MYKRRMANWEQCTTPRSAMLLLLGIGALAFIAVPVRAAPVPGDGAGTSEYWRTPCGGSREADDSVQIDTKNTHHFQYTHKKFVRDAAMINRNLQTFRQLYQGGRLDVLSTTAHEAIRKTFPFSCQAGPDNSTFYRCLQNWLAGFAALMEKVREDERDTSAGFTRSKHRQISRVLDVLRTKIGNTLCYLALHLEQNPAVPDAAAVYAITNADGYIFREDERDEKIAFYGQIVMAKVKEAFSN